MRYYLLLLALPLLSYAYDNNHMLCLVNKQRMDAGLEPLGMDPRLTQSAQQHSDDQAHMNSMTHDGSDGTSPGQRVQNAGYQWNAVAENVAYGYTDEDECMRQWMNSPGHRENILGPYTNFGSAVAYSGSTPYYTQDFGAYGKKGNYPACPSGSGGNSPAPSYSGGGGGDSPAPSYNGGGGEEADNADSSPQPMTTYAGSDNNDSDNNDSGNDNYSMGGSPSGGSSAPQSGGRHHHHHRGGKKAYNGGENVMKAYSVAPQGQKSDYDSQSGGNTYGTTTTGGQEASNGHRHGGHHNRHHGGDRDGQQGQQQYGQQYGQQQQGGHHDWQHGQQGQHHGRSGDKDSYHQGYAGGNMQHSGGAYGARPAQSHSSYGHGGRRH